MSPITVYVKIDQFVQKTEDDAFEPHIIAMFDNVISEATYEELKNNHDNKIDDTIAPIIKDLQNLIEAIGNDNFEAEVQDNTVILYHDYCPTLNVSSVENTSKTFKVLTYEQKVEKAKNEYIERIQNEINKRVKRARKLQEDFYYHSLRISTDELKKMIVDMNRPEPSPALTEPINITTEEDNTNENAKH